MWRETCEAHPDLREIPRCWENEIRKVSVQNSLQEKVLSNTVKNCSTTTCVVIDPVMLSLPEVFQGISDHMV